MAEKWTPGPWELREVAHEATPYSPRRIYRMEVIAPQSYMGRRTHSRDICQIVGYCEWNDHPANARLIAAAPELYEALNGLTNSLPEGELDLAREVWGNTNVAVVKHWRDKAKAALAKARGEVL